ncbi:MAG: EAL domain-containing protein [Lachnospiraceae bacterium]|nr:EAL domain-containing protein [Lachnospiraceae bacterium]
MEKITYFDYCALIMFGIVLVATIARKMTRGRLNRFFLNMIFLGIVTTLADMCAVQLDNMGSGNVIAKHISHTIYLYLHSLSTPMYIIYLAIQTDTVHKLRKNKVRQAVLIVPTVIVTVLMLVNTFVPVVYYLDEQDTYNRGSAFWVLYVVAAFYVIYGVYYLYLYKKTVNIKRFLALLSVFPLMLIAVLIQMFYENVVLEMFANACGILFITMMIQRAEERIDSETGLEKLSAYVSDMKRAFQNEKDVKIIMINLVNYKSLQEMLGYDASVDVKKMIAAKMVELNKQYGLDANLYYINDGKYRFVIDDRHFYNVEEVARAINVFMKEKLQFNQMDLNLISCVCIARCPKDIPDVDSLMAFGNDFNTNNYTGEVLSAEEHYRKEYYDIMKDIDRIIETALTNHKFSVYYQPIYSVKEERFRSAEALLRLHDEKYGFISPDVFIAAAEKSGAIYKIGEFVLEEVCKFIASDKFAKLGLDYIEINISVVQCMQNNMASTVLDIIRKYNVKPEQINLEITETAASFSQKAMMENLIALNEAGVHFSLDDFGTGYSNMKRIASLPLYLVKLDKSFTDMEGNPRVLIVLENTIQMIKAMNMEIVVEGVETENLVKQFSDLECEYIQGYYYSKPVPQDEFVKFIEESMA